MSCIIMNGITDRMGKNQHLIRSILEIMKAGGLEVAGGSRVMPDPILVGPDAGRVGALAREHGLSRWTSASLQRVIQALGMVKSSALTPKTELKPLPDHFRQSLQWQAAAARGSPIT